MSIRALSLAAIILTGGLAACTTHAPQEPIATVTAAMSPADAGTSPGTGACGEQITRLRRVLHQDREMGHVGDGVYKRMMPQIDRAAEKCRAGDQSGALAIISSVKKNNGYY